MRILAVDDDPVVLDLLRTSLGGQKQYELTCVTSAEDALRSVKQAPKPFECFLLDIMLPGIDGIDLCDTIRQSKEHRTTPIIMITASREPDLMGRAFYAGATDFVTKPLNGVELSARINSAALLNESLLRERLASHSLAELAERTKLRFEEAFALSVPEVGDLLALENTLLRLPEGVYAMDLFWVDVLGLRGVHSAVSGDAFRRQIEQVGTAIVDGLEGRSFSLAYTGSGRFACAVMSRTRLNKTDVLARINACLSAAWDPQANGTPMPPAIRITSLSDQRLWSGRSASDQFRKMLGNRDVFSSEAAQEEERLFQRFAREA